MLEANPLIEFVHVEDVIAHPDADTLDLVSPDGSGVNWAIVKRGAIEKGSLALWLDAVNEPMIPVSHPETAHLAAKANKQGILRIKAIKLRGVVSRGILIPCRPEWANMPIEDLTTLLGVTKYEAPPQKKSGHGGYHFQPGQAASGPDRLLRTTKYDVGSLTRGWKSIPYGATVYVTEKLHGSNSAYGWLPAHEGETPTFHVRSRSFWKKPPEDGRDGGLWWKVANQMGLPEKLQPYPGLLIYGEIFGELQDLTYGVTGQTFNMFDIWDTVEQRWFSFEEVLDFGQKTGIPTVPVIETVAWNFSKGIPKRIIALKEGPTIRGNGAHVREGVVIRFDPAPVFGSPSPELQPALDYLLTYGEIQAEDLIGLRQQAIDRKILSITKELLSTTTAEKVLHQLVLGEPVESDSSAAMDLLRDMGLISITKDVVSIPIEVRLWVRGETPADPRIIQKLVGDGYLLR